jgi:AbrB family looped-hinge helix DNA binding protein
METVRVLAKGQVVIPASVRRKYDIHPGSRMHIFEYGDLICLVPPSKDPIKEAMGCLPPTPSLSEELLKERIRDFAE